MCQSLRVNKSCFAISVFKSGVYLVKLSDKIVKVMVK